MSEYSNKYYGLYRALVVDNKDPEKRGRIKIYCPSVMDEYLSNWCVPCKNLASTSWELPSLQSPIWVMFEDGDVSKPVWVGGWWIPNENAPDTDSIAKQEQNWDKMIVVPKSLPVKDLNGNLENYFGYQTPFGGVYWKKDYDGKIAMKLDCVDTGELTISANGSTIVFTKDGDINITAKRYLNFNNLV